MSSRKFNTRSGSMESDYENLIDDKKRKRMLSNRESAKRSRLKKEQYVKDLNDQLTYFRNKATAMVKKINKIEQCYVAVDSENTVLRVQGEELRRRLDLLEKELVSFDTKESDEKYCVAEPWMQQTQPTVGIYLF